MSRAWSPALFYGLTAVSVIGAGWVLWNMAVTQILGHVYDVATYLVSQLVLTIWCLRDLYKRGFPRSATALNWFAVILLFGVVGTTAYLLCVKRRRWVPGK